MLDNIHKCPQMPQDMRILQTCGEVWELRFDDESLSGLKRTNAHECNYCGAVLMEDSAKRRV